MPEIGLIERLQKRFTKQFDALFYVSIFIDKRLQRLSTEIENISIDLDECLLDLFIVLAQIAELGKSIGFLPHSREYICQFFLVQQVTGADLHDAHNACEHQGGGGRVRLNSSSCHSQVLARCNKDWLHKSRYLGCPALLFLLTKCKADASDVSIIVRLLASLEMFLLIVREPLEVSIPSLYACTLQRADKLLIAHFDTIGETHRSCDRTPSDNGRDESAIREYGIIVPLVAAALIGPGQEYCSAVIVNTMIPSTALTISSGLQNSFGLPLPY